MLHLDGAIRAESPEYTWERLKPELPRYGITRVASLTNLDYIGIPVWTAIRPLSPTLTASQGKGATDTLAMISAAMESIELFHVEQSLKVDEKGTVNQIDPGYSVQELQPRVNIDNPDDIRLDWIYGTGIISKAARLVPCDMIRRAASRPIGTPHLLRATSTGLACGNTQEEALLHGMYEIVERDVMHKDSSYDLSRKIKIDESSIDDEYVCSLVSMMKEKGVSLELFLIPESYGLPVMLAYIWSEDFPAYFAGTGCHLDPEIALARAITEAAQSRITSIAGTRDDLPSENPGSWNSPPKNAPKEIEGRWTEITQGYGLPGETLDSHVAEVSRLIQRITKHEPIWVDLSLPGEYFTTIQVIAPGARSRTGSTILR